MRITGKRLSRILREIAASLTIADLIIGIFSIAVFILLTQSAQAGASQTRTVSVHGSSGDFVYDLGVDRTIEVQGPLGISTIEIKGSRVRFLDSPCRDKICVHAGWLKDNSAWTACLPNGVFLTVHGTESSQDSPDVIGY